MMNKYEGTIKSAVFSPDLTYRWGGLHGGVGYTLHIFIDLINGESVENVLGIPRALIEMNVYSEDVSKRYHYNDIKTGFIKTSYLKLVSPLVVGKRNEIKCPCRDVELYEEVTQRVALWSKSDLTLKKHRKLEDEFYTMSDKETYFYKLPKAHIKDLWVAEENIADTKSSYCFTTDLVGVN